MERVHLEEGVSLLCSVVASWPLLFVPNWDYWDYWDLGFGFFFLVFCMSGNGVVWAKFGLIEFSRCLSEGQADKIAVGSSSACSSLLWDSETCPVPSHALLLR